MRAIFCILFLILASLLKNIHHHLFLFNLSIYTCHFMVFFIKNVFLVTNNFICQKQWGTLVGWVIHNNGNKILCLWTWDVTAFFLIWKNLGLNWNMNSLPCLPNGKLKSLIWIGLCLLQLLSLMSGNDSCFPELSSNKVPEVLIALLHF